MHDVLRYESGVQGFGELFGLWYIIADGKTKGL